VALSFGSNQGTVRLAHRKFQRFDNDGSKRFADVHGAPSLGCKETEKGNFYPQFSSLARWSAQVVSAVAIIPSFPVPSLPLSTSPQIRDLQLLRKRFLSSVYAKLQG
jgi:hypothetical protein